MDKLDFSRLETNIIDVMKEQQLKLGYMSETVRLYYPLLSLNRFLGTDYNIEEMGSELGKFCVEMREKLGEIKVSNKADRFCLAIPPEGSKYVHEHMKDGEFISDFIKTVGKHGCTIDEILQQFYKYSDKVHVEKMEREEFDYLVYFEDGIPDNYRYCITDEGCHIIYHRFTVEDYGDIYMQQ